jgi:Spy/CpxP family protein refolding chaperone
MRWTTRTLLAFALVAPLAAPALAQPGAGPGRGPGMAPGMGGPGAGPGAGWSDDQIEQHLEMRADRIARDLKLTVDQKANLQKLLADHMAAARPQMDQMRQAGQELRQLLQSESPDPTEVGSRVIAMKQLREQLKAERKSFEDDFAKTLTPEQAFAWQALLAERDRGMDRDRGMMGHRPGMMGRDPGFGPRRGMPPPPPQDD